MKWTQREKEKILGIFNQTQKINQQEHYKQALDTASLICCNKTKE